MLLNPEHQPKPVTDEVKVRATVALSCLEIQINKQNCYCWYVRWIRPTTYMLWRTCRP